MSRVKNRITPFKENGRIYYIVRDGNSHFCLLRVTTRPVYMTVKVRIPHKVVAVLADLAKAERIALSESLIAEHLCRGCQKQKSREPPASCIERVN